MRKMTSTYLLLHLSHHIVCEHTVSWYWVYISGIQLLMNTLVPKSSPFFFSFFSNGNCSFYAFENARGMEFLIIILVLI